MCAKARDEQTSARWSRYRRPSTTKPEPGEDATAAESQAEPGAKAKVKAKPVIPPPPKRKSTEKSRSKSSRDGTGKRTWRSPAAVLAVLGAGVAVAIGVAANNGGTEEDAVDTTLLDEAFLRGAFDRATEEVGDQVIGVQLNYYSLSIETFDPTADRLTTYQETDSLDGYELRVENNHYDDYRPRPFDLSDIEPAALVAAAEEALEHTEAPERFDVRVEADNESGEVTVVATASGEDFEDVEVVATPDGEIVSVDEP